MLFPYLQTDKQTTVQIDGRPDESFSLNTCKYFIVYRRYYRSVYRSSRFSVALRRRVGYLISDINHLVTGEYYFFYIKPIFSILYNTGKLVDYNDLSIGRP